ncbi:hypothetical protein, partial [Rhizobium leguminosarum]|uniref:hypothetical protein n=1 Tax=Rhizobium leguminosarum TaxID=384 RepID=UPI003F9815F9
RHGELENETASIGWLFNNRENHMRNFAKDIVAQGVVYDPPWRSLALFTTSADRDSDRNDIFPP